MNPSSTIPLSLSELHSNGPIFCRFTSVFLHAGVSSRLRRTLLEPEKQGTPYSCPWEDHTVLPAIDHIHSAGSDVLQKGRFLLVPWRATYLMDAIQLSTRCPSNSRAPSSNIDELQISVSTSSLGDLRALQSMSPLPAASCRLSDAKKELQVARLIRSAQASKVAYERRMKFADLDNAIQEYEALLDELTEGHSDFALYANALCELYHIIARHPGKIAYDQQALALALKTLGGTPPGSVYRVDSLYSVGFAYCRIFYSDSRCETGEAGIHHLDEGIRLAQDRHPKLSAALSVRAMIMTNLALCGAPDERVTRASIAISTHRTALAHATIDDDRARALSWYALDLLILSGRLPPDWNLLDQAIDMAEESVRLTSRPHYQLSSRMNTLAMSYVRRWTSNRSAGPGDARLAQRYYHSAAELLPIDHYGLPTARLNEAELKLDIFETYGSLEDLETGLETLRTLISMLPPGHPHFFHRATYLGRALLMAFRNRGLSTLLDESIEWHELSVQHAAPHATWWCRRQLGKVLVERYLHQGDITSLKSAIAAFEQAEREAPLPHESRLLLVDLGRALIVRYFAQGCGEDLDKAVTYIEQIKAAADLENSEELAAAHEGYGQAMLARFYQTGCVRFLDRARDSFRAAVSSAGRARSSMAEKYHHLGLVERHLFLSTRSSAHLDDSIEAFRTSTMTAGEGHPLMASHQYQLALSLIVRSEVGHCANDLAEAKDLLETAYAHEQSFVKDRWMAARESARLLHTDCPEDALKSYEAAISLLPRVAWLGLEEQVRYESAQSWLSLGSDAAACALGLSRPHLAIELLESSRSVLWHQQLQLGQVNQTGLLVGDSALLPELQSVGRALEASFEENALDTPSSAERDKPWRREQAGRARRRLAERWEELVAQVRALPGAQDFLHRSAYSDLRQSAAFGPVVVLNVSEYRSDGIIILADAPPQVFPLGNASPAMINLHALHLITGLTQTKDWCGLDFADGQVSQLLQTLWIAVGEDLCLALQPFLPEGQLSRVWLMPTGALATLPLHAAQSGGIDSIGLMDVMIPSYTPTLSALIRAQERLGIDQTVQCKMLAIGCSKLTAERALPSWIYEKQILNDYFADETLTILEDDQATSEQVILYLKNHNFVHFTSHGHHDWVNPYRSYIALHDGPLTLRKIAQQKLNCADFAFLSACHTARIDPRAPDESINLASGLNLAGFRSIIGTMWGIADCDAGDAAEAVYSHLTRDGRTPSPTDAAEALHNAVQAMRRRGLPVIRWAPFIHIGI